VFLFARFAFERGKNSISPDGGSERLVEERMPSQCVLVIGGGLAGLSSAVTLAEAGFRVRLIEMRPHLGGRACLLYAARRKRGDNCQHVTLGCCTNLADFTGAWEPAKRFVL